MRKVLHISKYYYPFIGGVEQVALDCVDALNNKYEQKVICFNHEKGFSKDYINLVEVNRIECFAKIASQSISLSYGKQLKKILNSFCPDIVIFHYPNPFVAHFLCKYLKNKKFKLILWWHLDITKQKLLRKFFKNQNKKLLKFADRIVATSPNYIEGSPWLLSQKNKCVVIPCCVNKERLNFTDYHINKAKILKENYKNKVICFAFGRHVEYKGLSYLIKASKFLGDEFKILIGGEGPLTDALKKEALNDDKIEFLGKISDEELKSYFIACDIFCFPSITKNEAFGISLAEALFYGKPAITFTIPGSGVNWVNLDGVTGIEVPNKDVQKYAEAIECLKNPDLNKKYSDNSKKRANDLFEQSQIYFQIENLLKDVM